MTSTTKWIVIGSIFFGGAVAVAAVTQRSWIMGLLSLGSSQNELPQAQNRPEDQGPESPQQKQEKVSQVIAQQQAASRQAGQAAYQSAVDVQRTLKTIEEINRMNRMNQQMQQQPKTSR